MLPCMRIRFTPLRKKLHWQPSELTAAVPINKTDTLALNKTWAQTCLECFAPYNSIQGS